MDPEVAAAEWHARLGDDPDARLEAEFAAWRDASPAHRAAYDRVLAKQDDVRTLAQAPEVLALRHQTLVRLAMKKRADSNRRVAIGAAVAMVLVAAPVGVWFAARSTPPAPTQVARNDAPTGQTVQTAKGQRLTLTLADGSRVTLNTASRVRIAYTDKERHLTLEDGQAWFEVAKHQPRPFIVQAGGERIEAHGTAFDVHLLSDRTEVMLAEGKVTVKTDRMGGSPATVAMNPNELVVASKSGLRSQHITTPDAWADWRRGVVKFDNTPLSQATAEMNRYSDTQLVLADGATGRIAISGTFNAGETSAFVEALNIGFKVRATPEHQGKVVLRASR